VEIYVTGASGFIGGAVVRELVADNNVFAMSRTEAGDEVIRALGAEPLRSNLSTLRPGDLPEVDAVVHCAAYVEAWGSRADYYEANVGGTARVLNAARSAGARRFVHISTEAVLWRGQHLRNVDETYPYPATTPYLYAETKAEAERRVLAESGAEFTTIALRPRLVWGPGDQTLVPEVKEMVAKGAFMWLDGGRAETSTTHIDNLVHAVTLALDPTRGTGGEAYFVTDGLTTDFKSFVTKLMQAHGVDLPDKSMPSFLARPAAAAIEGLWKALRRKSKPPITRHAVDLLCCDCTLNDEKARRDLAYTPVQTVERGLAELGRKVGS
jgi:nucleoside-diphosphate-sugar epimerase